MFHVFHNLKVGVKILSGYAIALALMAIVAGVAIYRLQEINHTVTNLADNLAQDQHIADVLVAQVMRLRMYANKYIADQSQVSLDNYNDQRREVEKTLAEADAAITHSQRVKMLGDSKDKLKQYVTAFDEIRGLMLERDQVLREVLDKQGPLAESTLEKLSQEVFQAGDKTVLYYVAQAQRGLLMMRLNAFKYLAEGNAQWADKLDERYKETGISFTYLHNTAKLDASSMIC
jgi:methyl-accepting chemotaxis protein